MSSKHSAAQQLSVVGSRLAAVVRFLPDKWQKPLQYFLVTGQRWQHVLEKTRASSERMYSIVRHPPSERMWFSSLPDMKTVLDPCIPEFRLVGRYKKTAEMLQWAKNHTGYDPKSRSFFYQNCIYNSALKFRSFLLFCSTQTICTLNM